MKTKNTSRILVIALAVIMVFAMCPATYAVGENLTLTINTTATGHTYEAYQIFSGTLTTDGILTEIEWGAGVNSANLLTALQDDSTSFSDIFGTIFDEITDTSTAEQVADAFGECDTDQTMALAKIIGNNLGTLTEDSGTSTGPYTITGLDAGYYFIKDKDNTLQNANEAYTRFMLQLVEEKTITPKSSVPTVEKKGTGDRLY